MVGYQHYAPAYFFNIIYDIKRKSRKIAVQELAQRKNPSKNHEKGRAFTFVKPEIPIISSVIYIFKLQTMRNKLLIITFVKYGHRGSNSPNQVPKTTVK